LRLSRPAWFGRENIRPGAFSCEKHSPRLLQAAKLRFKTA